MNVFKNKKTRRRNLILVLIPLFVLIALFGYLSLNSVLNMGKGDKVIHSIDSMDYHLRAGATELQVDLFKELAAAVDAEEKDDEAIARLVVENFVADFYTWTNKGGSYDVGGLYYVYSPQKLNIHTRAKDKFYKYVSHYMKEYGGDNLLEVETVEARGSKTNSGYDINGVNYDSYYITCDWTYKQNDVFSTKDFETHGYFVVYKNENGRFEIVQAFGD